MTAALNPNTDFSRNSVKQGKIMLAAIDDDPDLLALVSKALGAEQQN